MKTEFVRFGKIVPVIQKHFTENEEEKSYHNPPEKKGFYAMPKVAQEFFLISSIDQTQPENFPKITYRKQVIDEWNENHGQIEDRFNMKTGVDETEYPKEYTQKIRLADKKYRSRLRQICKKFTLTNDDLIWSHLEFQNHEILKRSGSWMLTTFFVYQKSLQKELSRIKYHQQILGGRYSKDHFEVFITKKI